MQFYNLPKKKKKSNSDYIVSGGKTLKGEERFHCVQLKTIAWLGKEAQQFVSLFNWRRKHTPTCGCCELRWRRVRRQLSPATEETKKSPFKGNDVVLIRFFVCLVPYPYPSFLSKKSDGNTDTQRRERGSRLHSFDELKTWIWNWS